MLQLPKALAHRKALQDKVQSLSRDDLNGLLHELVTRQPGASAEAGFVRALAQVLWVRERFVYDLPDGKAVMKDALKTLAEAGKRNRKLALFEKDAWISFGNLYGAYGRYADAVQCYQKAIHKEQDEARKALGLLNIARAHVDSGDLYHALAIAQRIDKSRLADERLLAYFGLLKSKVLLLLGYERASRQALDQCRWRGLKDRKAKIEGLYRLHCTHLAFGEAKEFAASYAQLSREVAALHSNAAVFYQLEALLFAPLVEGRRKTSKSKLRTQARSWGERVERPGYARLVERSVEYLRTEKNLPAEFARIRKALTQLAGAADIWLAQVLSLLWAERLLAKQQAKRAAMLLNDVGVRWARLEAGFPVSVLANLHRNPSRMREEAERLATRIPAKTREGYDAVGEMLLESGAEAGESQD